ncbi:hypothetical protein Pan258_04150 [Symmachiella dynata]|uniref:Imm47 family immunity protein n=1 Tax=Symmachiella dynata TaxID=2527995 RepID=UPI00118D4DA2|nr:Imm47 family immunity protein [Symmachiella dynata]QDT46396.1 hypothetical protein Pan258_04150 [Symmachiella dynata]
MTTRFGIAPYRACSFYGKHGIVESVENGEHTSTKLRDVLEACKQGDFTGVSELASLMKDVSFDIRQYAVQLFAHVCSHQQVECFEGAVEVAEDSSELCRVAIRLGETLSLNAIPILLSMQAEYADEEVTGFVCTALRNILPIDEVTEETIDSCDANGLYATETAALDAKAYYYRGQPVFIGDVAKELIQAALVANREQQGAVLVRQPQMLSHFSGIECPVGNGQLIADDVVGSVYDYVEVLAKMEWHKGVKYFYHHIIP